MEEGKFSLNLNKGDFLLYLLAAALILGVTAFIFMRVRVTQLYQKAKMMTGQEQRQIEIVLNEQNESGESGTATLWEVDGSLIVSLNLTGAPPAEPQPAHIHNGSCEDLGGINYPLTEVTDGVSDTSLEMSLDELLSQNPQAINVHLSVEQANVYVACGDLP